MQAEKAEAVRIMVHKLAIDKLHQDCEGMRNRASVFQLLEVMAYETNISNAIYDLPLDNEVSKMMQGSLDEATKIRIRADANKRIKEAQEIYDAGATK